MIPFYLLNLAVAVVLLFVPLWFSRRHLHLPVLNPLTIAMLAWLPFDLMKLLVGPVVLIDEGLWDAAFQYAILMGNVLVLSQTAGMVFFFHAFGRLHIDRYLPFRDMSMSPRHLQRASYAFLGVFALAFVLLATAEFGLAAWIQNPRTGYQLYRSGQGHWYALAVSALSVAAVLSYLATPRPRAVIVKAFCFLALAYFLGSKGVMLAHFIAAIVVLWFVSPRHVTRALFLGAPLVFLAMAWNLYLALSDAFELLSLVEYFDYYKNGADYYRGILSGEIQLFHGEIIASSFWEYVPRALVPDKPFVYGILHINEIFYPGQAEMTNTPAFGGAVAQYADFGFPGVLVLGFFSGEAMLSALLYYLVFRSPGISAQRITLGGMIALLALVAPNFGEFFPGLLYWGLIMVVTVLMRTARLRLTAVRPSHT